MLKGWIQRTDRGVPESSQQSWSRTYYIHLQEDSIPDYSSLLGWLDINFTGWTCVISHQVQTLAVTEFMLDIEDNFGGDHYKLSQQVRHPEIKYLELRCGEEDGDLLEWAYGSILATQYIDRQDVILISQ